MIINLLDHNFVLHGQYILLDYKVHEINNSFCSVTAS